MDIMRRPFNKQGYIIELGRANWPMHRLNLAPNFKPLIPVFFTLKWVRPRIEVQEENIHFFSHVYIFIFIPYVHISALSGLCYIYNTNIIQTSPVSEYLTCKYAHVAAYLNIYWQEDSVKITCRPLSDRELIIDSKR